MHEVRDRSSEGERHCLFTCFLSIRGRSSAPADFRDLPIELKPCDVVRVVGAIVSSSIADLIRDPFFRLSHYPKLVVKLFWFFFSLSLSCGLKSASQRSSHRNNNFIRRDPAHLPSPPRQFVSRCCTSPTGRLDTSRPVLHSTSFFLSQKLISPCR